MNIRFPIGDWSKDGHEKCDYFYCSTNSSLEDVREAHFKCKENFGFDIGDICEDYEENSINPNIIDKIEKSGLCKKIDLETEMTSQVIFDIWIEILNNIDTSLNLKEVKLEYEDINFYGIDEKRRHLRTPGYGIFLD